MKVGHNFRTYFSLAVIICIFLSLHLGFKADDLQIGFEKVFAINSQDSFFIKNSNEFAQPVSSSNTVTYTVEDINNENAIVLASFDVRKPTGKIIVSIVRKYLIDLRSKTHVKRGNNPQHSGFLFGPPAFQKEFLYWHVNYSQPLKMRFIGSETISGVSVAIYEAQQVVDQTSELSHIEGVPEKFEMHTQVNFKLYVEPSTGSLVKFVDNSTVFFFDKDQKKRVHPWNRFSNTVSEESVQAAIADIKSIQFDKLFFTLALPSLLFLILLATWFLDVLMSFSFIKVLISRGLFSFSGIFALGTLITGLVVVMGWFTKSPLLIQIFPDFVPMQFNTALAFVLTGVAGLLLVNDRKTTSRIFALVVALIGLLTLLQYVFNIDLGIDEVFFRHYLDVKTSHPGRMAPNSAVCFFLVGFFIALQSLKPSKVRKIFSIIMLCLLASFASIAFLGYLISIETAYGWGSLTRMAVHTSFAFLLMTGFATTHLLKQEKNKDEEIYFPLAKILIPASLFVSLMMAISLKEHEKIQLKKIVLQGAYERRSIIENSLTNTVTALERMASRWSVNQGILKPIWEEDAKRYVNHLNLKAIEYVNKDSIVEWVYPLAGNEEALGLNLSFEEKRRTALQISVESREPSISRVVNLKQGARGLIIAAPIFIKEAFSGYIVGVIETKSFFNRLLRYEDKQTPFYSQILDSKNVAYRQQHANLKHYDQFSMLIPFNFLPSTLQLQVWPSPNTVYQQKDNRPFLYPLIFFCFSVLLIFALRSRRRVVRANEELVKSKRVIEKNEQRYDLAIQGVGVGVWDWDLATNQEIWNEKFYNLLGYSNQEIPATLEAFSEMLHPDDRDRTFSLAEQHFGGKANFDLEYRLKTKDGHYRWFRGSGKAQFTLDGKPLRMVGSIEDIHRKKELEIEQDRLLEIFENSTDYIGQIRVDKKVLYLNKAFRELTGFNDLNKTDISLWHPDESMKKIKETIIPATIENGIWRGELDLIDKHGQVVPTSMVHLCHKDESGEIVRFSAIFRDISDIKEKEEELQRSNEELEQFAFIASHDLKAPIRHIKSNIEVLEEEISPDHLSEDAKKSMSIINSATMKMRNLVDDLLNYSRFQRAEAEFRSVDINNLLDNVINVLSTDVKSTQATIDIEEMPEIHCNENMLSEVFQNLIGNALKYQATGSTPKIQVTAEEQQRTWKFNVVDNGIGIPENKKEYIFEIFKRLHKSSEFQGTGIGLAICKKLVEIHGGEIWLDLSYQDGSKFSFTIPKNLN